MFFFGQVRSTQRGSKDPKRPRGTHPHQISPETHLKACESAHVCWPRSHSEQPPDPVSSASIFLFHMKPSEQQFSNLLPPQSLTAIAPAKLPKPNRKGLFSNHHFSGANC